MESEEKEEEKKVEADRLVGWQGIKGPGRSEEQQIHTQLVSNPITTCLPELPEFGVSSGCHSTAVGQVCFFT